MLSLQNPARAFRHYDGGGVLAHHAGVKSEGPIPAGQAHLSSQVLGRRMKGTFHILVLHH